MPPQIDFTCPGCGATVHPNAKSCASCGTRPEDGWTSGGEIIDGVADFGLPGEEFDYDEFVAREFDAGGNLREAAPPLKIIWVITGIALVALILFLILNGLW